MNFLPLDWHTPIHIFGSYFLARLISHVKGLTKQEAAWTAFALGLAWEACDHVFKGQWIFDPRGGSLDDLIADALGCALALFI